ncbi:MAG TPA: glutamyl-tRNA reductase [Candidatus Dormibacteraeota bacterium]|nr:glutamyl-tRNA reductase [Candidatus Dormibacteraeota bacterium]
MTSDILVVGLSSRTAPLDILELTTVNSDALPKALHDLVRREHIAEAVVLSTCTRTEVYAVASGFHGAMADVRNFLVEWSGSQPPDFRDDLYAFYGDEAASHLFRVSSGIDSPLLGEGEIVRQVREAWDAARREGAAGQTLSSLFRHAIEVGKRARSETAISRGTTSLSQAAVAMAAERLDGLLGRTALVVGAGEMGRGIAQALASVAGAGEILVANRTSSKAIALAERVRGRPLQLDHLVTALEGTDLVVTSTGSPDVQLTADDVRSALPGRRGRPLMIVDVAVPRDVDPAVGDLPGVTLLNMDDLKAFVDASIAQRRHEVGAVNQIVAEEVERFFQLLAHREAAPVVAALRQLGEQLRQEELDRHRARLTGMTEQERAVVESVTRGILAKLLHEPTVRLKAASGSARGDQLTDAVRTLFALPLGAPAERDDDVA